MSERVPMLGAGTERLLFALERERIFFTFSSSPARPRDRDAADEARQGGAS